jgi:exoribonuclease R
MFPEPLSTNIISLTEGNISRAFTLELSYDNSYEILSHKFYKSHIRVKNLTYEEAENHIQNKLNKDLLELYNFGLKHICQKDLYDSHKMVEVFMILCNKFAAIEMKDIKSIIRYNNSSKIDLTNIDNSIDIDSKLLEIYQISNNEAATYEINTELIGHKLLNLEHYTHFSSPLRRYVDLVLHRILYAKINNEREVYSEEEIKNICLHINNINKIYKLAYNIDKLNKLLKDKTILELECDLVYFNNNLIKLYYNDKENDKDLLFFVNLIHSKIKDNIIIESNSNELSIKNEYNEIINLKLFQKIKIKIFKLKNSIKTYQISLVDPILQLI